MVEGSRLDWSFITKSLFCFEHSAWYLMCGRYLINIYRGILSEWVVAQRTFNIPSLSSSTISLTSLEPSITGNASVKSQLGSHVKGTKSQSPPLYSCYLFVRMFFCVCVCGENTCMWGCVCIDVHACRSQRSTSSVVPQKPSAFIFLSQVLLLAWNYLSPGPQSCNYKHMQPQLAFYIGTWGLNWGPHASGKHALPNELFQEPSAFK